MNSIAYFADGNYPSHDIKWINYLNSELGVKAIVFLRSDSETKNFNSHVTIYPILKSMPLLNPLSRWRIVSRYKSILDEHEVQLVHFMGGELKCQYGPFLRRPFIITTRGTDILEQLPRKYSNLRFTFSKTYFSHALGRYFHRKAYKMAQVVTSTSFEQLSAVKSFQPLVKAQQLVRTGCFTEQFLQPNIQHSGKVLRLFSPRTMKSICNQDIILKAFAAYLNEEPQAQLYMVDNLPERVWSKKVRSLATALKIGDNVHFLPRLNREEMKLEYNKADVVIMIPRSDGTPVSAVECMLVGSPLILGNYQYDKDLFNRETVWQLSATNEESLLSKLHSIREQINEKGILNKLSIAQKVALNQADTKKEMSKLYNFYESILVQ